jgi:dihydrodipicolinate synthase/N-acetylneuraminate lyase
MTSDPPSIGVPEGAVAPAQPDDPARFPRTILPTVCIPWTEDLRVDVRLFQDVVRARLAHGIRYLYVFGTAGEGHAVTDGQFDTIVRAFTAACAETPDAHPMVGLISQSAVTQVERAERAMALGVRLFQFTLPAWGVLTDDEVRAHARFLLARFPEAGFLHYNLLRAGRLIGAPLYAELAAEHPNLVATKQGTGDVLRIHALLTGAPMLRHFLTEVGYPFGCSMGRPGLLQSLSSTNERQAWRFFRAGIEGDLPTLAAMQAEYLAIEDALTEHGGAGPHMDGAFEKMMQKLVDERVPLRLLPPYASVSDAGWAAYKAWMHANLPHLLPDADA